MRCFFLYFVKYERLACHSIHTQALCHSSSYVAFSAARNGTIAPRLRRFFSVYWKWKVLVSLAIQFPKQLLQLCESRLDNVVYRLGISPSRRGARQLVSHRHITVNGEIVNIPSYLLREGDVIGVREKSKPLTAIESSLAAQSNVYEWLSWNQETLEGRFVTVPERIQIPENINEQFIVELYSK